MNFYLHFFLYFYPFFRFLGYLWNNILFIGNLSYLCKYFTQNHAIFLRTPIHQEAWNFVVNCFLSPLPFYILLAVLSKLTPVSNLANLQIIFLICSSLIYTAFLRHLFSAIFPHLHITSFHRILVSIKTFSWNIL